MFGRHRYCVYISHLPLVFVATVWPLWLPLMRLDAWLPQHLPWVATGLIPAGFLSRSVFRLFHYSASGLLTAAGSVREGDGEGGEVTGGAHTPGFPPPAEQNELYQTPLDT